jgi:hypothetical protein
LIQEGVLTFARSLSPLDVSTINLVSVDEEKYDPEEKVHTKEKVINRRLGLLI